MNASLRGNGFDALSEALKSDRALPPEMVHGGCDGAQLDVFKLVMET